jgi:hypothetical protein
MKLSNLALMLVLSVLVLLGKRSRSTENPPIKQKPPADDQNHTTSDKQEGATPYAHPEKDTADEKEWRAEQKENWRRQVRPQWAMVFVTVVAVAVAAISLKILGKTLDATNETLRQSREFFEASQRPHVSLGGKDGKVGTFSSDESLILLHFYNSGPTPALNFVVSAWDIFSKSERAHTHMNRYKPKSGPGIAIYGNISNDAIPAESSYVQYLVAPRKEQLVQVKTGKNLFRIEGIYDYCDKFGRFRSETFMLRYRPPPINDFTSDPWKTRSVSQMSDPTPSGMNFGGHTFIPVKRCKQPNEENNE